MVLNLTTWDASLMLSWYALYHQNRKQRPSKWSSPPDSLQPEASPCDTCILAVSRQWYSSGLCFRRVLLKRACYSLYGARVNGAVVHTFWVWVKAFPKYLDYHHKYIICPTVKTTYRYMHILVSILFWIWHQLVSVLVWGEISSKWDIIKQWIRGILLPEIRNHVW